MKQLKIKTDLEVDETIRQLDAELSEEEGSGENLLKMFKDSTIINLKPETKKIVEYLRNKIIARWIKGITREQELLDIINKKLGGNNE